jgi:hypothetical protein
MISSQPRSKINLLDIMQPVTMVILKPHHFLSFQTVLILDLHLFLIFHHLNAMTALISNLPLFLIFHCLIAVIADSTATMSGSYNTFSSRQTRHCSSLKALP